MIKKIIWFTLSMFVMKNAFSHDVIDDIQFGQVNASKITQYVQAEHADIDVFIPRMSALFIGVPYQSRTLEHESQAAEQVVANLGEVDCFTFIDYVEALRRSESLHDFMVHQLPKVRYKRGEVTYLSRKHFFSDWVSGQPNVEDITADISSNVVSTMKYLNQKPNGHTYIAGLNVESRLIHYIPSEHIKAALPRLRSGDYIGIYTHISGLDVTHVGIFIRDERGTSLRHASSKEGCVTDADFISYVEDKPGIVVYRASE